MIKPGRPILVSIKALENDGHFRNIRKWIDDSLYQIYALLPFAKPEPELRMLQGRAQELKDIRNYIEKIDEHMKLEEVNTEKK